MKEDWILTIKAEVRPGLLHLVTGIIEKRLIKIESLTFASTDIHSISLITIKLSGNENELITLVFKLENIIEVFSVEVSRYNERFCLRAAYFKLSKNFLESPKAVALSENEVNIIRFFPDALLVSKCGTDAAILKVYNDLDGPNLLGFNQTGLITDSKLIGEDESSVISMAA